MSLHLFVVHFPVALLVAGAAADLAGAALGSARMRAWGGAALVAGGAFALLAFLTGGGALQQAAARLGPVDPRVEAHQQLGAVSAWVLAGLAALRAAWMRDLRGARGWLAAAAALAMAALAVAVTLSGQAVSHG